MPYSSIQDVSISQGIAERLFGLASLKITNASSQVVSKGRYSTTTVPGGVALVGLTLAQAEKINGVLKEIVKKQNPGAMGL